jgi:hypothetical protein
MAFYAWTQDLPIDAAAYGDITDRIGDSAMPGLVVHVAAVNDDGRMHYLDVWESQQAHDEAFANVIHPAVHPVLAERRVEVDGEPPRTPITVVEVRFADGTTVRP